MRALLLLAMLSLVGCQIEQVSPLNHVLVQQKVDELQLLSDVPRRPIVVYNINPDFDRAGETNCKTWTISLNATLVQRRTDFMLDLLLPHEYAHLESCFHRGNVGDPSHDEYWSNWVIHFGGDPTYI